MRLIALEYVVTTNTGNKVFREWFTALAAAEKRQTAIRREHKTVATKFGPVTFDVTRQKLCAFFNQLEKSTPFDENSAASDLPAPKSAISARAAG